MSEIRMVHISRFLICLVCIMFPFCFIKHGIIYVCLSDCSGLSHLQWKLAEHLGALNFYKVLFNVPGLRQSQTDWAMGG